MSAGKLWLLLVPLVVGPTVIFASPGCSQQGEGERCDQAAGISGADSDCDDGLVCVSSADLGTQSDICCPEDVQARTDPACIPGALAQDAGTAGTGGAAGTGGVGGSTGGGGGSGGGGGTGGGGTGGGGTGGGGTGGGGTGGGGTGGGGTGGGCGVGGIAGGGGISGGGGAGG